jgi:DNA helicase-2/ATP-dependent DNA helicase PcrA
VIDTNEQIAIFDLLSSPIGNLIVEALAGTGKTTTALRALTHLPQKSVLFCAFNKRIADELVTRMPKAPKGSFYKAQTFHSIGLAILKSQKGLKLSIDKNAATEKLVNDAAAEYVDMAATRGEIIKVNFGVRRATVRLLRTLKETQIDRSLPHDVIVRTGHTYDLFQKLALNEIDLAAMIAQIAYRNGSDLTRITGIDFCDMTWLPVVLDMPPPSRFQAVLVDEAQDLSLPQLRLVQKMIAPGGRLVAIGDRNQQIYSWRGAVGDLVWREMRERFSAQSLPLTTTFRCATAIVNEAKKLVPSLNARAGAPAGLVSRIKFDELGKRIRIQPYGAESTFLLSRNNADLLNVALHLWRLKIDFVLAAGAEIVEPLYDIIDRLDKSSKPRFSSSLMTWYQSEMAKAEAANATAWADRIEQQFAMLSVMLGYAEPTQFKGILADILANEEAPVTLSTVHKAKGLEADRVFLLRQTFARHQPKRKKAVSQEELNIEYVAITRAKHELIWVDLPDDADALTRILSQQTSDDREKDGPIGGLARQTLDGRLAIVGRDGTSAIMNPGDIDRLLEGVTDEEEAARRLGLWPLPDDDMGDDE